LVCSLPSTPTTDTCKPLSFSVLSCALLLRFRIPLIYTFVYTCLPLCVAFCSITTFLSRSLLYFCYSACLWIPLGVSALACPSLLPAPACLPPPSLLPLLSNTLTHALLHLSCLLVDSLSSLDPPLSWSPSILCLSLLPPVAFLFLTLLYRLLYSMHFWSLLSYLLLVCLAFMSALLPHLSMITILLIPPPPNLLLHHLLYLLAPLWFWSHYPSCICCSCSIYLCL